MSVSSTQIAAGLSGALGSTQAGLALSGMYGTVAAVNTSPLPTVDVYLNNNPAGDGASITNSLPYLSGYNPSVGDAVFVLAGQSGLRTSYLVIGIPEGSTSGGGSSGVPIGAIQMFPVVITYPNWLLCNGATFSSSTYPVLYALLGSTTLPDLRNLLPMGAGSIVSLGNTAGSQTANGLVAHTHTESNHTHSGDPHTHSHNHTGPSHTHTGPSHSHTDSGHTHSHSHTYVEPVSAGAEYASGSLGGLTVTSANTGTNAASGTANLSNSGTGATGAGGTGNTSTDSTGSSIGTTGSGGPGSTNSAGSGSSFNVLNPTLGVAWYIRAG